MPKSSCSALRRRLLAGAAIALPLALALPAGKVARAEGAGVAPQVLVDVLMGHGVLAPTIPWAPASLGAGLGVEAVGTALTMGGSIDNPAGATIAGDDYGVLISGGAGTVTNAGTIAGTGTNGVGIGLQAGGSVANAVGGTVSGVLYAVEVFGTLGTVTNAGLIAGGEDGVLLGAGGTVDNQAGGTIVGTLYHGVHVDGIGSVANAGTIIGGEVGVILYDGGTVANAAAGTILGGINGIAAYGSVAIANAGLIGGTDVGVLLGAGGSLDNAGTITGGLYGVLATDTALAATVTNAGLIAGGYDGVLLAGPGTVVNAAGGTIVGATYHGIHIDGPASVFNAGTVLGGEFGIVLYGGGVVDNLASGFIYGGYDGIALLAGSTLTNAGTVLAGAYGQAIQMAGGTVVNTGLASGGVGIAAPTIFNFGTVVGTRTIAGETVSIVGVTNNDLLVLGNGSVLVGRADGGAAGGDGDTDTVLLIQSGFEDDDFVNYATLRVNGVNWDLAGTSTFVTSRVEVGRLGIDGTLVSPSVSVMQPGTLGGRGTVVGTVFSTGTVNPGPFGTFSDDLLGDIASRIGTLTVDGAFANCTCAVFQVEVTPTASDRLVVIGTPGSAVVNGSTAHAVTGDAMFTPGQRFTVLTTTGTVGGLFGTLTTDFQSVFIDPTLQYLFNNGAPTSAVNQVDLVFVRNGTMVNDVARTFNQRNVAGRVDAIETIGAGAPAPFQTLINLIQNLDTERDVQDLLDNLSGEAHGSTESLLLRSGERFVASVLSSGGASAFSFAGLAAAPGEAPQVASLEDPAAIVAQAGEAEAGGGAGLWVRPFAVTGNIDSDGNAGGFDFSVGGIAGGAAFEVAEGFFLGAALGYEAQEADFDRFGDDAEADTLEAAIYAGFEDGPLRVTGALGYAHHSVDMNRNVTNELGTLVPVTSDYDADQILVGAAGSYAIEMDGGLRVTPQAALTFARLDRDGFTERGDTPGLLDVGDETTESLLGRIGARIAMDFEMEEWTLTPAASLDVAHEFLDEFGSIDARFAAIPEAGSFTARGAEIGPTAVELGLGLAATDGEGLGFFLDYRGGFSSSGEEHSFAAGLRLSW